MSYRSTVRSCMFKSSDANFETAAALVAVSMTGAGLGTAAGIVRVRGTLDLALRSVPLLAVPFLRPWTAHATLGLGLLSLVIAACSTTIPFSCIAVTPGDGVCIVAPTSLPTVMGVQADVIASA
jgi:hypothetical protein